jgi:hypothetical protein
MQSSHAGLMQPGGMDAWLSRAGVADVLHTPARQELQQVGHQRQATHMSPVTPAAANRSGLPVK